MNWEQAKDLPIGHVWDHRDLGKHFQVVAGGLAYPGKRPGFAVVAGLRPVHYEGQYEIHVLDEIESPDLGELLRLCRGLTPKYHRPPSPDEYFLWFGDYRNTAAQALIRDLNSPTSRFPTFDLCIRSTSILNMATPYAFMVAKIREYTVSVRPTPFLPRRSSASILQRAHGYMKPERRMTVGPESLVTRLGRGRRGREILGRNSSFHRGGVSSSIRLAGWVLIRSKTSRR